jgi:hypothetical protein
MSTNKVLDFFDKHASLVLDLDPIEFQDSVDEKSIKLLKNEQSITEFVNQLSRRVMPQSNGKVFLAVFEMDNLIDSYGVIE